MAITNSEIAKIFSEYADLLEIKGENPFKVRAYRNAARTVENIGKSLEELVNEGYDLTKLPGIGTDLSLYIKEIVKTGKFSKLEQIKEEIPPTLVEMLSIEGLGPKRIKTLYEKLHIQSMEDLRRAAESGEIEKLPGFGPTLVQKILKGVRLAKKAGHRFKWSEAKEYVDDLLEYLHQIELTHLEVAGSFRRKKETVGDLDILATAKDFSKVIRHFVKYPKIKEVVSAGSTRSTVILNNDLQVDLRSVEDESYGSALHYFTGSKAHNIEVRKLAIELGLKVNEYGVFKGNERIAGKTEEEVYKAVGLCYIEPELRENRGEIEACKAGKLPKLVELSDIKGDLHMHTVYSDGKHTIEDMAKAAKEMGYEYIAITDHSKRLTVAHGLDEKRALKEFEEIDKINETIDGITILKGMEVDILEDGSLDMSDEVLAQMDVVLAAVHYKFNLDQKKQTDRILRALDNPYVNIIAHPTGRMINMRQPIALDMTKILQRAKENGVFMEINAQPDRLDLNDVHAKMAKELGVKMAINTDTHNIYSLFYMQYGVNQARRGWCEKEDIINTRSLDELRKLLKR
ncbi:MULTISPECIES: DNA polymerase/3'-5' exonuclease PolX [unclassified Nitratiruptor]|uniref:DNA polymerase/3'-5' exonuclease PolX n=1 Tax=unclassified Nitratiruptor TaxID=2624044 RepID=UPI001915112D|nr:MULTISPECIES: DNA polymerase/3'-5' exonuclease PolX [unclassified Nitratiruptor]BCD60600.1 DNA polymerase [Nitratiruptor sp. YY08-10]BCD64531.1 DNA polymerase [Nitratiruptor sp. YY08-14]